MPAPNPTPTGVTISPTLIAYLHDKFKVSDKHLYRRYATQVGDAFPSPKPISSGHNHPALPPHLATHISPHTHRLTYATVAYILHRTAPPPSPLMLASPGAYEPFHIPANAHVVHRSYNSADFSKDNLVLKYKT